MGAARAWPQRGTREGPVRTHTRGHAVGSAQLVRGHGGSEPGHMATHPRQHLWKHSSQVGDTDGQVLTTAITGMSTPRFPALLEACGDRARSLASTPCFIKQKDTRAPHAA